MAKDAVMAAAERERPARSLLPRRIVLTFGRAVASFWRHGDLFSGAAISFYAFFSLLPLTILLLVTLQFIFPAELVARNIGRLFGLTDENILLRTIREAYTQQGSFGLVGAVTLIVAAAGVFGALQSALDRVWECRGRTFHLRFLFGVLMMALSLLIFVAMLLATVQVFRLIRTSELGVLMGWPRKPPSGAGGALASAIVLTQFIIFWIGYRFLPNAYVRWRDAWPGAAVATVTWHMLAYVLGWYLARLVDYATLYHQLQALAVLMVWVYGISGSFLLGAEFVMQWTVDPGPVESTPAAGSGSS